MKGASETLRTAACVTALREEKRDIFRFSSGNETGQVSLDVVTENNSCPCWESNQTSFLEAVALFIGNCRHNIRDIW